MELQIAADDLRLLLQAAAGGVADPNWLTPAERTTVRLLLEVIGAQVKGQIHDDD